ncbi:MAG TPA: hypothetical protein VFI31_07870 [Pirellulales bacterium]|nr:hypothetical protein [Pirellulales bacterium]
MNARFERLSRTASISDLPHCSDSGACAFRLVFAFLAILAGGTLALGTEPPQGTDEKRDVARERLKVMTDRMESIVISSDEAAFPKTMQPTPLFRYDDETRGYVDGTVWRLGKQGRPLAIITAELHPNYLNTGPKVVYDFLSLTERRFTARSSDIPGWMPRGSAVTLNSLLGAPAPAKTAAKRLTQIKEQVRRFSGTQDVQEIDRSYVQLRLLPREIDRYSPTSDEHSEGAIFIFANGRNPAVLLLIETDGSDWQYGIGRLSAPSQLEVKLDNTAVWTQPRFESFGNWSDPYTATNVPAEFP